MRSGEAKVGVIILLTEPAFIGDVTNGDLHLISCVVAQILGPPSFELV